MSFFVYKLDGHNPFFNLAFEEYIFSEMKKEEQDIYFIIYENKKSVILGKNLIKENEIYSHKKMPPVLKRSSGGGSVVHFYGNLNYGLILNIQAYPRYEAIQNSYAEILSCLAKSMTCSLQFQPNGISDLCFTNKFGPRKISGNSQARKKKWLLHHGTILYDTGNIRKIAHFLQHPSKEPDYRNGKKHADFLVKYLPRSTASEITRKIIQGFSSKFSLAPQLLKITPILRLNTTVYLNKILQERRL
ncbi:MAG: hypothetical protein OEV66_10990 [Spirochaetia bacterium]|nr:hypothetical protein [Spirochaetia bacterium]